MTLFQADFGGDQMDDGHASTLEAMADTTTIVAAAADQDQEADPFGDLNPLHQSVHEGVASATAYVPSQTIEDVTITEAAIDEGFTE